MLLRPLAVPVTGDPWPHPSGLGGYDVDAAFMSLERHGCHIHVVSAD
jgi:hypothetical protein